MNFEQYLPLAIRTCKFLPNYEHFKHMAYGLTGEMGEFIDAVKKHEIYGKELDVVNLHEEYGDLLWYLAGAMYTANLKGSTFDERLAIYTSAEGRSLLGINADISALAQDMVNAARDPCNPYVDTVLRVLMGHIIQLSHLYEIDISRSMELNIQKLAKRYGDKYSDYAALNRDTEAERQILEQ